MADVDPVGRLLAIEEIKQLKARYFRFIDTKNYAGLVDVFAPDATGPHEPGVDLVRGNKEIAASVERWLATVQTAHHGHMPEIEIESATTARGIWTFEDQLWNWPPGESDGQFHGYGIYHETYVKLTDGWRITSMEIERIRTDVLLVGTSTTVGMIRTPREA
jgi:23S rRNA A2030 N6-methylase RlmJ